jgi:lipopolysaccharide export system protein LptA
MKRFFLLSLLTLNMLASGFVHAERADAGKPTSIEADRMVYDDAKQINTFSGNVILTRGTLVIKADRIVITQDSEGAQSATVYAAPGSVATFRQKRDGGPNLWIEGQAERIEYEGKTELVKLYSNAQLRRLEGNKPTDQVEGEYIAYDGRSEFFTVNNTASGESKPGAGRVKAVIQPRAESKGK